MFKILSILFISYFVAIEGRLKFPIATNLNVEPDVTETETKIDYRLPQKVTPYNYKITLTPYLSSYIDNEGKERQFTFDGEVEITLGVEQKEVENITLHARNLTIEETELFLIEGDSSTIIKGISDTEDKTRDFLFIKHMDSKNRIKKGKYRLVIKYSGILHDDMRGFYRSSYKNDANETVWLATTHFEPVGARRAFPCFDEPALKATFDVVIKHDTKYYAISNAIVKNVTIEANSIQTTFEQTQEMSTYLLAFVVSDFGNKTNKAKDFTVHARKNAIQNGELALIEGQKLLKALETVTNVTFDLGKMDQVAIPDFAAGAMENWGLVTYREKSLLFEEGVSTTSEKQNIIETIAHEFAHQWFGDLVSPKWWKYLWLNEGFANFFQSYITDKVDPTWESVNQAVVKSIQTTAFDFDSGPKTHPINADVESPTEISAIFDSISYQKGGAVIRMMQHFLTDEVFMEGLNIYLMKYKKQAADSDDLFKTLQDVATKNNITINVKDVMDSWVNRKGYPIVTVTRDYENGSFEVKQERFFSYNASDEEKNETTLWHIPINYAVLNLDATVAKDNANFDNTTPDHWLTKKSMNISANINLTEVLILNKQQTGFYRVNYDETNWNYIIQYLNSENRTDIHELTRAQLVNDGLAFVKQGIMNLTTLLKLTEYLKNETSYIAWYPGFKTFSWVKSKLINSEQYPFFQEQVLNILSNLIETVGLEESKEDKYVDKLNRITALNFACSLGHKGCHGKMQEKVQAWLNGDKNHSITSDLKQITLCNGLRSANLDLWKSAFDKCITSTGTERSQLITALACSENSDILNYYLNETIKEDANLTDTEAVIDAVRENSVAGVNVVLNFLTENLFFIYHDRVNKSDSRMTSHFNSLSAKITTPAQFEKLKKLTKEKQIPNSWVEKAFETASENVAWLEENSALIADWTEEAKKDNGKNNNGVGTTSASITLISSLLVVVFVTFK